MSIDPNTQATAPVPGSPEHEAAMAAKYEAGTQNATDDNQGDTGDAPGDRPAGLPEKFKSVEEMAKAYDELQKKLGSSNGDKPAEGDTNQEAQGDAAEDAARKTVADAGLDFDALAANFAEHGVLPDADYAKLEEAGIPRDIVDGFIQGQLAVADNLRNAAFNVAGGEDNYKSMIQWAQANMSPDEIKAFNQTVESNSADQIKFAVSGLKARYEQVNGSDPSLMGGNLNSNQGDTYANWHQVKEAMRDPRYAKDAAYRRSVEEKLGRSSPT